MDMRVEEPYVEATFLRRMTRFSALVQIGQKEELVYVPNSGRMRELLLHGNRVLLHKRHARHRKTKYDMTIVRLGQNLVPIDSRIPSKLIAEAVQQVQLSEFREFNLIKTEVQFGQSRLDLLLRGDQDRCYIEVKSVTLVQGMIGRFPDAPTIRGTRHLEELIRAKKTGARAAIIFVIQRDDAKYFAPNDETDPKFALKLREGVKRGVEAPA